MAKYTASAILRDFVLIGNRFPEFNLNILYPEIFWVSPKIADKDKKSVKKRTDTRQKSVKTEGFLLFKRISEEIGDFTAKRKI